MKPPAEAATLLCPFARVFAAPKAEPGCKGHACALWRWQKITTSHPLWTKAIKDRVAETGEKAPYRDASKFVADNLEVLGMIPSRGYCGAGGEG